MKLIVSYFLLALSAPTAAAQVVSHACLDPGTPNVILAGPTPTSTVVRLPKVSNPHGLCTLLRRASSAGDRRAPLARSYANNPWERTPGWFAKDDSYGGLDVDCAAGDALECDVTLPPLGADEEYVLESRVHSAPAAGEAARFLEQATFGPTRSSIDALVASGNDFRAWIADQVALPPSSLRRFYRENTNPKFEFPYYAGAVSSAPCELHSRWRAYALSSRDCLQERKAVDGHKRQKHLEIRTVGLAGGGTGYAWYVDDELRTVTDYRPTYGWGNTNDIRLNVRHRIGTTNGANWRADCVGCAIPLFDYSLTHNAAQRVAFAPNPAVSTEGVENDPTTVTHNIVPLPSLNTPDFPSIDNGENYPVFATWIHPNEDALLNTTSLEESAACDGHPNFKVPMPHTEYCSTPCGVIENGVRTEDPCWCSPKGRLPTVFGTTPEGLTFLYDPHLALLSNTVEDPLPDGGGRLVMDTDGTPTFAGRQVMCQNVERNFLNAEGCKLSYDTSACKPGEYPTPVIELNEVNVKGIRDLTAKDIYITKDMDMSVLTLDVSTGEDAPCGDGEQRSRWMMIEGTGCENDAGLDGETIELFRALIDARSETAFNSAGVEDVKKFGHGMQCASTDTLKVVLGNVQASDGTCWRHVHKHERSVIDFGDTSAVPIGDAVWYEGEDQVLGFGTDLGSSNNGYSGAGYADFHGKDSYLEWTFDAGSGGLCILTFRYAQGTDPSRPCSVLFNGEDAGQFSFSKTIDWEDWQEEKHVSTCLPGSNVFRLTVATRDGGPNLDGMTYQAATIDESTAIDQYITQPGSSYVTIPSDWTDFHVIGKLGDYVELGGGSSPPAPLHETAVQDAFRKVIYNPLGVPVLVCGSPDEVASDPFNGDQGFDIVIPENEGFRTKSIWELSSQRHTTWTHLALHAPDELRQRVAWALSQIVAVGLPGSGMVFYEPTEQYTALYDIFVRNAFGSYRTLMQEFSFNKLMGEWLSFVSNKSLQYNIDENDEENYPDENFAREIMQLFSIGLYQLNPDGTRVLEDGQPVETYQIDDIVSYARAWTGLATRSKRGGASTSGRHGDDSLDSMQMNRSYRDLFPKSDLHSGFIGDRVPLCADLPSKHFIRKGAAYNLLASSARPELQTDSDGWGPETKRLELDPSSPLFAKLCAPDVNGDCTFPSTVKLEDNLIYDAAAMMGDEYIVDTIRTVLMKSGGHSIYYEYIRQPCVEHSFYTNAVKVMKGQIFGDGMQEAAMCANPRLPVATPMCCPTSNYGHIFCRYQGERVSLTSAEAICTDNGMTQCQPALMKEHLGGTCALGSKSRAFRSWAAVGCELKAKISLNSGEVAIVHEPEPDTSNQLIVESLVGTDTLNFFKAHWDATGSPSLNDCLALGSCVVHSDGSCICSTQVTEVQVFSSVTDSVSIDQLLAELHIGAVDPAAFDDGTYTFLGSCGIPGVNVYSISDDCSTLSPDTIFGFVWKSKQFFLKNSKSTVHIVGSDYSFRNPVQFNSLADPEIRDMYHETDEVINSLFYHPSHPPFLVSLMAQRLGISNPSPAFVKRCVEAYDTGSYEGIGSDQYGDLGAMISCLLLDDETRQVVLDADPSHGQLREPLVKVLAMFRSMEISFNSPLRIATLLDLNGEIGQGSFESPSVFSFFLPDFTPNTRAVQSAGLVAPESMVLQGDNIITLLDSFFNVVKFGVTESRYCDNQAPSFEGWRSGVGDFGFKLEPPHGDNCASQEGDTSLSPASPNYWPTSTASVDSIIDDLSLVLTAGRLGAANREIIKAVASQYFSTDVGKAVRVIQQLLLSTPEFHSTGLPRKQNAPREVAGYDAAPTEPYKALVVFVMSGGCDSFNLLVPKGQCESGDQYIEYSNARGGHTIAKDKLTSIMTEGQNCAEFGVNEKMPLISGLYNSGEALFFSNTGVLSKPMTKDDEWTKETSFQLFAHNTMLHEAATGDPYEINPGTGVYGRMLDAMKNNGYHTSANGVGGAGESALTGDQLYSNPVYSVSSSAPDTMNKIATVDNLLELVKQLNGVGDLDNSVLSESWSAKVTSALFQYEQMLEIASNSDFEVNSYGKAKEGSLNARFKAIAEHMKSRSHRKVNRDIYIVADRGYDLHAENTLSELLQGANGALQQFKNYLDSEGLWDSTAILMSSDFGRSLNPNSNGGTDHAWGGNYFLMGGNVKGGRILGTFPQPLTSNHPNWIGRGRFIPTTPWDSVWNGIGQWLGISSEADLDWVLPNRRKFANLFSGQDLFNNVPAPPAPTNPPSTPEPVTPGPMKQPVTHQPSPIPTPGPISSHPATSQPTAEPTNQPVTLSPTTTLPTPSPTTALPTPQPTPTQTNQPITPQPVTSTPQGTPVANVVGKSSPVTVFGCTLVTPSHRAVDANTDPFQCSLSGGPAGVIISPYHYQLSHVHGLRVYSSKHYPQFDPVSYVLEGRADSSSPWQMVSQGDFPWISQSSPGRNPSGNAINSSYESGDASRTYTEVSFPENNMAYLEYKIIFLTRSSPTTLKFSEVELPGLILASSATHEVEDQTVSGGDVYSASGVTYWKPSSGAHVDFGSVDAGSGGNCVLSFRYTNNSSSDKSLAIMINGTPVGSVTMPPTASAQDWSNQAFETWCAPGINVVRATGTGSRPLIDSMTIYKAYP